MPGHSRREVRKPKDVRVPLRTPGDSSQRGSSLYPWRYATDKATPRERARFRTPVSDLRKTLLSLNEDTINDQLTLEQGARDPEELEAELAEEQAMLEQLRTLGQVVIVGFASNPERHIRTRLGRRGAASTSRPAGAVALLGAVAAARGTGCWRRAAPSGVAGAWTTVTTRASASTTLPPKTTWV